MCHAFLRYWIHTHISFRAWDFSFWRVSNLRNWNLKRFYLANVSHHLRAFTLFGVSYLKPLECPELGGLRSQMAIPSLQLCHECTMKLNTCLPVRKYYIFNELFKILALPLFIKHYCMIVLCFALKVFFRENINYKLYDFNALYGLTFINISSLQRVICWH